MPSSSAQREPTIEYLSCVAREEELSRLREQAKIRKSLLVFGPEGVGKSSLLRTFVETQTFALYVGQMRTPREFVLALLQALHSVESRFARSDEIASSGVSRLAVCSSPCSRHPVI
jgi:AAA+ ATPase superfamily predicted ATPase